MKTLKTDLKVKPKYSFKQLLSIINSCHAKDIQAITYTIEIFSEDKKHYTSNEIIEVCNAIDTYYILYYNYINNLLRFENK